MVEANSPPTQATGLNFEAALEQLQQTVKRLESGELSLELALSQFEEGVKLTQICQKHLSTAEQRVEMLMKSTSQTTSEPELQPFPTTRS